MPDASPAKWHLAHVTWFFETFVLRDHVPGYRAYDDRYAFLFNSYYEAEGARHPRDAARDADAAVAGARCWRGARMSMRRWSAALPALRDGGAGAGRRSASQHEQQHQELLLTDILNLFAENPLAPAVWDRPRNVPAPVPGPLRWIEGRERDRRDRP